MYEKRDVTYSANTGQRYALVSHAHERCVINNMASVCYSTEGTYQDDDYICERHYLLLDYLASHEN